MRAFLFTVIISLSFGAFAQQNQGTYNPSDLKVCIAACQFLVYDPNYAIRHCVAYCQSKFGPKRTSQNEDALLHLACETYEPGCTRPGDGDEDGQDDRDQTPF